MQQCTQLLGYGGNAAVIGACRPPFWLRREEPPRRSRPPGSCDNPKATVGGGNLYGKRVMLSLNPPADQPVKGPLAADMMASPHL